MRMRYKAKSVNAPLKPKVAAYPPDASASSHLPKPPTVWTTSSWNPWAQERWATLGSQTLAIRSGTCPSYNQLSCLEFNCSLHSEGQHSRLGRSKAHTPQLCRCPQDGSSKLLAGETIEPLSEQIELHLRLSQNTSADCRGLREPPPNAPRDLSPRRNGLRRGEFRPRKKVRRLIQLLAKALPRPFLQGKGDFEGRQAAPPRRYSFGSPSLDLLSW